MSALQFLEWSGVDSVTEELAALVRALEDRDPTLVAASALAAAAQEEAARVLGHQRAEATAATPSGPQAPAAVSRPAAGDSADAGVSADAGANVPGPVAAAAEAQPGGAAERAATQPLSALLGSFVAAQRRLLGRIEDLEADRAYLVAELRARGGEIPSEALRHDAAAGSRSQEGQV